ncbi:MAG: magnesium transporter CorA family protein [Patescibacteria group bacterium]|jgi:magnesium transporter
MINCQKISDNIYEINVHRPKVKTGLKWINIINAQNPEIEYLKTNYNFNLKHLNSSLSTVFSQRPMISQEPGYVFIVLHFPIYVQNKIIAGEIEFFIGHGYLITVHNGNIPALNEFFESCQSDPDSLSASDWKSSIILLYEILNKLVHNCYGLIDETSAGIARVEDLIFARDQKDAVSLILNLRRNIINIRKILQNHESILKSLTEVKSTLIPPTEVKKHYNRLVEHSKRIWNMLDNQKEMIEVLNSTNQALLDNQMTNVMKTLTIFSVIVFPLTLLAAIFGMNTKNMPIVNHPYGFWIIVCIMSACSLAMLLYFEKKKWL